MLFVLSTLFPERDLSSGCPITSGVYKWNAKAFTNRWYHFAAREKVGGRVCYECGRRAGNVTTSLSLVFKFLLAQGLFPTETMKSSWEKQGSVVSPFISYIRGPRPRGAADGYCLWPVRN